MSNMLSRCKFKTICCFAGIKTVRAWKTWIERERPKITAAAAAAAVDDALGHCQREVVFLSLSSTDRWISSLRQIWCTVYENG